VRITPIDIQQQQFKTKLVGGYDQEEVDRFLETVAEEIEQLTLENQQVREELGRMKSSVEEMRERELTLRDTLITTQKVTDDLKANARREAELIVANSQMRAEKILQEVEEKRLLVLAEIQELRRQKVAFETNLRTTITGHLRLLEVGIDAPTAAEAARNPALQPAGALEGGQSDPDSLF